MNCPEWEERILRSLDGEGDAAVAAHLRDCPTCAVFAAELELDARRLRVPPPDVAVVDYPALRVAARKATWRIRRRKVLAVLAVAAMLLLASRLALHHEGPRALPHPVELANAPPVAPEIARDHRPRLSPVAKTARPRPVVRTARAHPPQLYADIDRQFAEYLRSVEEARHPARPAGDYSTVIDRIATENPRVTILLLQESKGDSHE